MSHLKTFFMSSTGTAGKIVNGIYILLHIIVVIMLVDQIWNQHWENTMLLLLTLILFEIPYFLEKILKIQIPNMLEIILLSFIFSSTILGELSDSYGYFSMWDTFLHAPSGFSAGGVGFSLVYLLNRNTKTMNLTPLLSAIVSFYFSMTVGVMWESVEFSADKSLQFDMQKDTIIQQISSVESSKDGNTVYRVPDITWTVIESQNADGKTDKIIIQSSHLDIGIIDTMKDLFANLIGAVVFSIFGYSYSRNDYQKFTFIKNFTPKKIKR